MALISSCQMSSFFNSIFKVNPCICLHLSASISPHLAVLKEFWNLITLFCTRAIWKFSNPKNFSWGNANLLNQNFLWKCNFNQVFQHRHISDSGGSSGGETHPIQSTSSQAVRAQAWLQGDLALSSGTEQGARWSHIQTMTWATELSALLGKGQ